MFLREKKKIKYSKNTRKMYIMKKSYGQVSSFLFIKVHLTLLKIFIRK